MRDYIDENIRKIEEEKEEDNVVEPYIANIYEHIR